MNKNSETVSNVVAIYAEKYQPHFTLRNNAYAFSSLVYILLLTKKQQGVKVILCFNSRIVMNACFSALLRRMWNK